MLTTNEILPAVDRAIVKYGITSFQLYYNGILWACRIQGPTYIAEEVGDQWGLATALALQDFEAKQ